MARAISLEKAYFSEQIPKSGAFIITSIFDPDSVYSILEITAYAVVKDIFQQDNHMKFLTDGNRTHILVEPPIFPGKSVDPTFRDDGKSIPYRFYELEILTGKKQEKIMIPKDPIRLHTFFTIQNKSGDDFSYIFYPSKDVYVAIKKFVADVLYNDCNLEKSDALEASKIALETIKRFSVWEEDK